MKLYKPTLFDGLVFALLVYLAFGAFGHGQGLPKGALGLSGTVYAPAGQDILGTIVVACYVQGEDCDEAKSQFLEITESGSSASFNFTDLGRETYMLFASKDVNANEVHFEDGDLYALYGADGNITPPAPGVELELTILGSSTTTTSVDETELNTVTGIVLDTQGRPIEGAKVWIEPALTIGLVEVRTGADGRYSATSLIDVPYYAKAWTQVQYNGQDFCLRLGMPNPGDFASFVPVHGEVRNFQWQLTGVIEDLKDYDGYFGAEIRLFLEGDMKEGLVELTFTPTAPLIDGSTGQTITRTINVNEELMVYDIPIGLYDVSGVLLEDGSRTPLRVGMDSAWSVYNDQTETAMLEFTPNGCGNGNGTDRAFLYLNSPYEY
jgi:hypothetical protein